MSPARNKKRPAKGNGTGRRKSKHTFTTRSGQTIKLHRSLSEKFKARKAEKARRRAARLSGMPKSRVKRFFYRLHPKRMYKYWFSREGAIMALKVTGIGIVAVFLMLVGLFAYFRKDLPNLRDISGNNIGGSIRYYDRTGEILLWEDYDAVKRIPVHDENISQFVKDATIAVEDKDFFKHGGFDLRGITRAALNNVFGDNGNTQGGSTITQQLARLTQTGVGNEKTYQRKVKELIISIELERSYSKQEILVGYLNTAPYGNIQYGVEAASRDYFQKSAKDLTLDEAAFMAAIPKSPSFYSPYGPIYNPEALVGRQHYILDLMLEQQMINKEQLDDAKQTDTLAKVKELQPKYEGIKAPWFVLTAKEQLEARFTSEVVNRGGWKVTTTLDTKLQEIAEDEVKKGMPQVRAQGGDTAAFVAEDVRNGQIVALVGGSDFRNKEFGENNYARAELPPGSSFKPYDYSSLIENTDDFGAGTVLYDTLGPLEGYPCTTGPRKGGNCLLDFDFRFPGPLTLRYALGGSRNIPAVKAMLAVGVDKTIETAEKLGLESGYNCYLDDTLTKKGPCYASSAIGDGAYLKADEHVHAYATISRNGLELPRTYILKIEDAAGKVIDEWQPSEGEQRVRPDSAYIVADMMADPNASYFTGSQYHRYNGHKFSLKTGTTNDAKDGWLMGFSTYYSAGVWVGYHNRQVEMSGFMENMTRPIWHGWMQRAHDGLKPKERERPKGIQVLPAYVVRNHVGLGSIEPSPSTDLYPSWYQKKAIGDKSRTIDIVSNKLATDCTPDRAKKELNEAGAEFFSSDPFVSGNRADTSQEDDVHKCDDKQPGIAIISAPDECEGSCSLTVSVTQGTHPISSERFKGTINLIIGNKTVKSQEISSPGNYKLTFGHPGSGTKSVLAEVIDSVLYDSSDSVTINFDKKISFEISDPSNGSEVNSVVTGASWQGGAGPYAAWYKRPGESDFESVPGCSSTSNTSCTIPTAVDGDYELYVEDKNGDVTPTVSFEKK